MEKFKVTYHIYRVLLTHGDISLPLILHTKKVRTLVFINSFRTYEECVNWIGTKGENNTHYTIEKEFYIPK